MTDKQLRITKAGDEYIRRLLVGCSHYILGAFGPDSELRRFGLKLAARGGKNAKRRAIVAVARKLGVLLHRLWVSGEEYDPEYLINKAKKVAKKEKKVA
jgi:transposase